MSTFTSPMKLNAIRSRPRRFWPIIASILPPSFSRPTWAVAERFEYAVGSLDNPSMIITVPEGFEFDGASVPMLFWFLFPMAHPDYIQAAALHDYIYQNGGVCLDHSKSKQYLAVLSRRDADNIFYEALGVLGMALHWRWSFWLAVRVGGALWWYLKKRKGL